MNTTELAGRLNRLMKAMVRERLKFALPLLTFASLMLGHLLTDPAADYQRELCAALDEAMQPGRRLIGVLPREHAKTTLGTVALTLHELLRGEKKNIMLIAANREEAQVKLRQIVNEIETNKLLPPAWRARLGPARDMKGQQVAYSDGEIVLANGARVSASGTLNKIRGQLTAGRRLDLVILDDPEDDQAVRNPDQRRKLAAWLDHVVLNALDVKQGSLVWLGTLLHHDSALAKWLERHQETESAHWRVIRHSAYTAAGEPLWPGRWTKARLAERQREIGDRAFAQEFLNQPLSLAGQVFRAGDFLSYDPAQLKQAGGQWYLGPEPLTVAIGVDPAVGEQSRHDYFAACVLGLAGSAAAPRIYLLDLLRDRLRFSAQLTQLARLNRQWLPRLIGIESTAYQAVLSQRAWEAGLPVSALSDNRPKAVRIEAAAVHAARGAILLPTAGAWVAEFRSEALEYPAGAHDDQLDAFARGLETLLALEHGDQGVLGVATRTGHSETHAFAGRGATGGF
ncbi:phage terminase large subunit [bacterium]|nr:phage terminase large subunit [bacterium]